MPVLIFVVHTVVSIVKVYQIYLMNAYPAPDGRQPSTQATDMGCESACGMLLSTSTIAIYYSYLAEKLILFCVKCTFYVHEVLVLPDV